MCEGSGRMPLMREGVKVMDYALCGRTGALAVETRNGGGMEGGPLFTKEGVQYGVFSWGFDANHVWYAAGEHFVNLVNLAREQHP